MLHLINYDMLGITASVLLLFFFFLCRYVGRVPCASVATGSKASHTHEEESILKEAFADI